jgi:hypothetical protein
MDLNHRVVAQVEGLAKRVICQTCKSEHQYKPKKDTIAAKQKEGRSLKPRKSKIEIKPVPNIWEDIHRRFDKTTTVNFQMSQKYKRNDCLAHPTFGIGFVQSSQARTIEVLFAQGVKILAHNR